MSWLRGFLNLLVPRSGATRPPQFVVDLEEQQSMRSGYAKAVAIVCRCEGTEIVGLGIHLRTHEGRGFPTVRQILSFIEAWDFTSIEYPSVEDIEQMLRNLRQDGRNAYLSLFRLELTDEVSALTALRALDTYADSVRNGELPYRLVAGGIRRLSTLRNAAVLRDVRANLGDEFTCLIDHSTRMVLVSSHDSNRRLEIPMDVG